MYSYLTDREKLIQIAGTHTNPKNEQVNWKKASEEANLVFQENQGTEVWRGRYKRAYQHLSLLEAKVVSARKQFNTENHLRQLGTLEQARASVLTEEALRIIEKGAKPLKFNKEFKNAKQDNEYVFVTSDFHYDGNEFNLYELSKVHSRIKEKQKEFGFKRIKLLELGDIVEGSHLRPSQLLAIKKMLIPQTIEVAHAYVQVLEELTKDMFVDFYCVTSSNHTQTRPFGSGRNEFVEDDAMIIFADIVKTAMSKNKNFSFTSGKDFIVDVSPEHKMFVAHGHLVDGKKNGYIQELAMARGVKFDYALFGHFHHYREITLYGRDTFNMKVFYAPSMNEKHSDYEHDRNLSSKAGMLMMVFNEHRGHKYCEELFMTEQGKVVV